MNTAVNSKVRHRPAREEVIKARVGVMTAARLDELARAMEVSKAEILRQAVQRWLDDKAK